MIDTQLRTRLLAAESDELVDLLTSPSLEEAEQLRAHLGPLNYQRMRSLALRKLTQLREAGNFPKGNLLFVPAMLHNELSVRTNGGQTPIWLSARAVLRGDLQSLRLDDAGLNDADPHKPVFVSGVMKRYCGELLLTLAQSWTVRTFAYDWRKSLKLAATQLQARIEACFPPGARVHIVAVGEGGIVARLYVALFADHWQQRSGRLITIGTPHQGAPLYLQALAGHLDIVHWADTVDPHYERAAYLALLHTFPSLYQLLPFTRKEHKTLLQARTYGNLTTIRQEHLDSAHDVQKLLAAAVDPAHMLTVVGYGRPSCGEVDLTLFEQTLAQQRPDATLDRAEMEKLYQVADGDGHLPLACAEMPAHRGKAIPTRYVDTTNSPVVRAPALLHALDGLLQADRLDEETPSEMAGRHRVKTARPQDSASGARLRSAAEADQAERLHVEQLTRRLRRTVSAQDAGQDTEHERALEGILLRNLAPHAPGAQQPSVEIPFDPPAIAIEAILGDISQIDKMALPAPMAHPARSAASVPQPSAVDAIAVGHYVGGTAQSGLDALAQGIDECMANRQGDNAETAHSSGVAMLTDLLQRGTIRGELADIFLLPDPRAAGFAVQRLLAIAGMGAPGRFGAPELAILVRELCWTLGHIGKKHLVTVLIGAGQNNLTVSEAVDAWVRGIKLAITGADPSNQLQQITFVEYNPQRVAILDHQLQQLAKGLGDQQRMYIGHTPLNEDERREIHKQAVAQIQKNLEQQLGALLEQQPTADDALAPDTAKDVSPVRITVEYDGETYRFGAITKEAAVADRQMALDERIVNQANDRLASYTDVDEQQQQGEFLAKFLFPDDFQTNLSGGAPIILTLDATTARIHWEMLCLSEQQVMGRSASTSRRTDKRDALRQPALDLELFLGTACGLTRQLRTPFARPPEPLPQQKRVLRVLVVADPAADARLPGAEEEGHAVADLLELFNLLTETENRIEVVRLISPVEATRVTVLQHLMLRSYDVLHFAGHCVYDAERPRASGWIFSDGERLTAGEIQRIDRVPGLIVSNACESGITPERAGARAAALAPTFAESFFARGVANFVCTAWPVGDREARDFALSLYAALLGLEFNPEQSERALRTDSRCYRAGAPQPFHVAMRNARRTIAGVPYDHHSWGAYQHYGNPYARLFAPESRGKVV